MQRKQVMAGLSVPVVRRVAQMACPAAGAGFRSVPGDCCTMQASLYDV